MNTFKLSGPSLQALKQLILGDCIPPGAEPIGPYRSHQRINDFFDELDVPEHLRGGGGRDGKVIETLKQLNKEPLRIAAALRAALHPGHFADSQALDKALAHMNEKLQFDRVRVSADGGDVVVDAVDGRRAIPPAQEAVGDPLADAHLQRLLKRAEDRLSAGDFDTAITEARTIVEDALHELEWRLLGTREDFGGDVVKLYKRVAKELHLEADREDLDENYRAIVRALTTIVGALAPISNASSSRHSPTKLPAPHHARLCVNAAKTLVYFLRDSFLAQLQRGRIRTNAPPAPRLR